MVDRNLVLRKISDQEIHSMHPEQIKIYKRLSPAEKLRIAGELYTTCRKLKTAALRRQHPDWSVEEVKAKVREIFLYART